MPSKHRQGAPRSPAPEQDAYREGVRDERTRCLMVVRKWQRSTRAVAALEVGVDGALALAVMHNILKELRKP